MIKYCKKQGAFCILMHNKIKKEHDYYLLNQQIEVGIN